MPAYNFGMLTAGLPDLAQRQVSAPVLDETYYQNQQNDWNKNWQSQWDAAAPVYRPGNAGSWSGATADQLGAASASNQAGLGLNAGDFAQYNADTIARAQNGDVSARAYLTAFGINPGGAPTPDYYDAGARQALEAQKAKQQSEFDAAQKARQANQTTQQSAYNQSNGGGFSGGVINASYGTPFGNDSTMAGMMNNGIAMPNDQPWGSPAYGGPQGGESQAGFGGGSGMMNAQPQGWGGPFTAKNPWSLS